VNDHVATIIRLTDLQHLDTEDKWVEVIDGEIVAREHNVTFLHVVIIDNLYDLLKPFVKAHKSMICLSSKSNKKSGRYL
jgi:hypothetical protein